MIAELMLVRATSGAFLSQLQDIGGDVQYLRTKVTGQYLYPMFYKRAVLGFDAEAGVIDGIGDKVARSTRFLIGGRKVRGFDAGGIGPRDTGDNSAIGGINITNRKCELNL